MSSVEYQTKEIPIADIFSDPEFNCRGETISPMDVRALAADIEANGLMSPIIVQPFKHGKQHYRVVVGHRRIRAFQNLKRETIPCFVKEDLDEHSAGVLNLSENLKRKDLNILQEARALERLYKLKGWTIGDTAEELGVSGGWVQVRFNLVELPFEIQEKAAAGYLTQAHIKDLYGLPRDQQFSAVAKIIDAKIRDSKKSITIDKPKGKKGKQKKIRSTTEIARMQDFVYESLGPGLLAQMIGWIGGFVNNEDIFEALEKQFKKEGKLFKLPEWYEESNQE